MNSGTLELNGVWELYHTDDFPAFLTAETVPGRHAFHAAVPAPIHQVLMDAGVLDDPRVGMNSLRARWVEEEFWAYRRAFATPAEVAADVPAWLCFDRLEMNAVVYLNGAEVGRHANAHRPATFDVTGKLRTDGAENVVSVLIEAGLFDSADKPGAEYRDSPQAKLTKIHWQRRGQWQRGWDWQQRLLNVGILGDVRLEWDDTPRLGEAAVFAVPSDDLRRATFHARAVIETPNAVGAGVDAELRVQVFAGDAPEGAAPLAEQSVPLRLTPGRAEQEVTVPLENPRLWWPVGHGEPYLYYVTVGLVVGGAASVVSAVTGVRKVEVDQSPHAEEGRHFTLKVNGRPIFCKGGNWVPADMLYSTVTPERYQELVDLALDANFNMLRVWGGGVFADPALLDYCDEKGMLVWHDLLFACSKYPGDFPEFAAEARREVTWAMREMAHHPSLVVWCGNNEIEEGDWHWGYDARYRTHPHYALFHHDLPQIAAREAPHCFYWISSPYSPDYKSPRDPTVGDQHPWKVSLQMAGGSDWWEYRKMVDRFPNEGGVLGCSSPATLRQFLPEGERRLLSASWEHHDNPFAINDTQPGRLGHAYQTVELWTGRDPLAMGWEEYAFVSALLQAEGLSEYIRNFRRRMFSSASAIFWMYNDSWPVTHGWTIVDYYRRRKLAYHPVRRAFAPVAVVIAEDEDGQIRAWGVNDTPERWNGVLSTGVLEVGGRQKLAFQETPASLPANAATELFAWPRADFAGRERTHAPFAALSTDSYDPVAQDRLFLARFGEMEFVPDPKIDLHLGNGLLALRTDAFAWGVCLDVDGERLLADNCFDLVPGIPYTLPWDEAALGEPRILRVGNRDALGR